MLTRWQNSSKVYIETANSHKKEKRNEKDKAERDHEKHHQKEDGRGHEGDPTRD